MGRNSNHYIGVTLFGSLLEQNDLKHQLEVKRV